MQKSLLYVEREKSKEDSISSCSYDTFFLSSFFAVRRWRRRSTQYTQQRARPGSCPAAVYTYLPTRQQASILILYLLVTRLSSLSGLHQPRSAMTQTPAQGSQLDPQLFASLLCVLQPTASWEVSCMDRLADARRICNANLPIDPTSHSYISSLPLASIHHGS